MWVRGEGLACVSGMMVDVGVGVCGVAVKEGMKGAEIDRFNEQAFEGYTEALSSCPNCSRTFLPDRLQVNGDVNICVL